jgi:hypothetical protein
LHIYFLWDFCLWLAFITLHQFPNMKAELGCALSVILIGAACARADDLPRKLSFDRYTGMLENSPFAVATAVVAPTETPNFAKDLYVANAARSPAGTMVTIASTSDGAFKKYLTKTAPMDGYAIVRIKWSAKVGKTRVTISKDGQLATLTFNQMLSAQPLPNRPPSVTTPAPFQQSNFQRPTTFPTPNPPSF